MPEAMICELPEADRPRERLLRRGAGHLQDRELLAVLLRTGRPGTSALGLADELLGERGGLAGLLDVGVGQLRREGLGPAKAATLMAALEIGRRLSSSQLHRRRLGRPGDVARHIALTYTRRDQEVMGALYVDVRGRLLAERELYRGTLSRALVEPRQVLKEAFFCGAAGLVLFHTHPSGDPTPSLEDVEFTRQLAEACDVVDVALMDHLIVGHAGRWVSMKDRGLIPQTRPKSDSWDDDGSAC